MLGTLSCPDGVLLLYRSFTSYLEIGLADTRNERGDQVTDSLGCSSVTKQTGRTAGNRTTVIALRLRLFNFVRTVELRKAECGEFDLGRAE